MRGDMSWQCSANMNREGEGGDNGFGCFFEPISSCGPGDNPHNTEAFTPGSQVFSEDEGSWMPPEYAEHGLLWWRSQLAHLLFRPLPALLAWQPREPEVYWTGFRGRADQPRDPASRMRYVGVHVRRGDKASEVPLAPIESFLSAAAAVASSVVAAGRYQDKMGQGDAVLMDKEGGEKDRLDTVGVLVVSDDEAAAQTLNRLILDLKMREVTQSGIDGHEGSGSGQEGERPLGVGQHGGQKVYVAGKRGSNMPKSRSGHLVRFGLLL